MRDYLLGLAVVAVILIWALYLFDPEISRRSLSDPTLRWASSRRLHKPGTKRTNQIFLMTLLGVEAAVTDARSIVRNDPKRT